MKITWENVVPKLAFTCYFSDVRLIAHSSNYFSIT
jgi:hypothetical protein